MMVSTKAFEWMAARLPSCRLQLCRLQLRSLRFGLLIATTVFAGAMMSSRVARSQPADAQTDDVLLVKNAQSGAVLRRKGLIEQWQGRTISLRVRGKLREIDSDQVVQLDTHWSDQYQQASQFKAEGQTSNAVQGFVEAIKNEQRPWARRIIRAQLMDAYLLLGQPANSAGQFLAILAEDPNTRFINQMPLRWDNGFSETPAATQWMTSDNSAAQLLGASWSLTTPQREQAIKVLGDLAGELDPRIRDLATAQLWRTRVRPTDKLTRHWHEIIAGMLPESRCGPLYLLANAQQKLGQTDDAILSYMKIVTLYEQQSALSAASLSKVAGILETRDGVGQGTGKSAADRFRQELKQRFPESRWSQ